MIRRWMPYSLYRRLWGDRQKWGRVAQENDPDFVEWKRNYLKFYQDTQKGQIGQAVCDLGFAILGKVPFDGKKILEIGPGYVAHLKYHKGYPQSYSIVDMEKEFLVASAKILEPMYGSVSQCLTNGHDLPFEDNEFDLVLTFHQLEHCEDLGSFLDECRRVLKDDGLLVGAVPTEGGLAWGLGRYLTSRRYVKKHHKFDLDKIICWEHPNFVDEIEDCLDSKFRIIHKSRAPFSWLPGDFNLSFRFIYQKPATVISELKNAPQI